MKKTDYISKVATVFVLGLVLFLSVFGKQVAHYQHIKESAKVKTKKSQPQPVQTTISELSLEVLVPSHAFDFNEAVYFIPRVQFDFPEIKSFAKIITKPIFRLSFFEKLFELHIAINAP